MTRRRTEEALPRLDGRDPATARMAQEINYRTCQGKRFEELAALANDGDGKDPESVYHARIAFRLATGEVVKPDEIARAHRAMTQEAIR